MNIIVVVVTHLGGFGHNRRRLGHTIEAGSGEAEADRSDRQPDFFRRTLVRDAKHSTAGRHGASRVELSLGGTGHGQPAISAEWWRRRRFALAGRRCANDRHLWSSDTGGGIGGSASRQTLVGG